MSLFTWSAEVLLVVVGAREGVAGGEPLRSARVELEGEAGGGAAWPTQDSSLQFLSAHHDAMHSWKIQFEVCQGKGTCVESWPCASIFRANSLIFHSTKESAVLRRGEGRIVVQEREIDQSRVTFPTWRKE